MSLSKTSVNFSMLDLCHIQQHWNSFFHSANIIKHLLCAVYCFKFRVYSCEQNGLKFLSLWSLNSGRKRVNRHKKYVNSVECKKLMSAMEEKE